jgi:GPH family glycoside/pentoside/hexuronide:cation symporter
MSENETAPGSGPKPIRKSTRVFYGFGDYCFASMTNVETYFFNYFLTNVANFAGGVVTTIALITSIVDAGLSWIYGSIVNAVKPGRFGRYRTWLVMAPWIVPFLYTFQFLKIGDGPLAYVLITLGFILSHIAWNLPWAANITLVSVAGGTPEGRAALAASRATWVQIAGITFGYIGPPLATFLGAALGEQNGYAALAFVLGWMMVLGYFVNFIVTSGYEEIEITRGAAARPSKTGASPRDMAKSLFLNPHLCFLLLADIPRSAARFVPGAVAVYYFQYVASDMGMLPHFILLTNLGATAGAFIAGFIGKKMDARNIVLVSYAAMAVSFVLAYFYFSSPWAVIILMTVANIALGVTFSMSIVLYADAAVFAQWKLGADSRGWIMGLSNVPIKIGIIGRALVVNISLMLVGFNAAAITENPELVTVEMQKGITAAFALIPAAITIIGIPLLFFGYRLTREKIVQYGEDIEARKTTTTNNK